MPESSCAVTEMPWLSAGESPTKAESWAPMKVMFEYLRVQSEAWPLQVCWAWVVEMVRRNRLASSGKNVGKRNMFIFGEKGSRDYGIRKSSMGRNGDGGVRGVT